MQRMFIAVALLAVLVAGCVWSDRALDRTVEEIAAAVETDDLETAYQKWTDAETLFGSLLLHDELDEADRLFERIRQAKTLGKDDELALCRAELLAQLRHLPDLDEPSVKNIL